MLHLADSSPSDGASTLPAVISILVSILSVPAVVGVLRAVMRFVNPTSRLVAQIQRDVALLHTLPETPAKSGFTEIVDWEVRALNERLQPRVVALRARMNEAFVVLALLITSLILTLIVMVVPVDPTYRNRLLAGVFAGAVLVSFPTIVRLTGFQSATAQRDHPDGAPPRTKLFSFISVVLSVSMVLAAALVVVVFLFPDWVDLFLALLLVISAVALILLMIHRYRTRSIASSNGTHTTPPSEFDGDRDRSNR